MADDAAALLDALRIEGGHVVGASMGGMIAQTLAIRHRDRVASLASIMSTTGSPDVGTPTGEAMAVVSSTPATDRAAYLANKVTVDAVMGSGSRRMAPDHERSAGAPPRPTTGASAPPVTARQLTAIMASGDRTARSAARRAHRGDPRRRRPAGDPRAAARPRRPPSPGPPTSSSPAWATRSRPRSSVRGRRQWQCRGARSNATGLGR